MTLFRSHMDSQTSIVEYRGSHALAYAAQTGAQLMWRRRTGVVQPIGQAAASALWKFGAVEQIVCRVVDHRALAGSPLRRFARVTAAHARRCAFTAHRSWLSLQTELARHARPLIALCQLR